MHPAFERRLAKLSRLVGTVISRGVITLVNDLTKLQELQISLLADETLDGVERFQQYGFTSHPKPGAEVISLSLGGDRGHTVVIAVDDRRYRLNLLEGEAALYDDTGNKVHLRRAGGIDVISPVAVNVTAPVMGMSGTLNVDGPMNVAGAVTVTGALAATTVADEAGDLGDMRTAYNTHTHADPASGNTGGPSAPM